MTVTELPPPFYRAPRPSPFTVIARYLDIVRTNVTPAGHYERDPSYSYDALEEVADPDNLYEVMWEVFEIAADVGYRHRGDDDETFDRDWDTLTPYVKAMQEYLLDELAKRQEVNT